MTRRPMSCRWLWLANHCRVVCKVTLIALLALMMFPACSSESSAYSVIGEWKLTAALDSAEIAAIDERGARRLVGKILRIEKKQVGFGKRLCRMPDFAAEHVETRLYLREHYRAEAARLALPNHVTVVHLDCTSAFVKSPDRIVVFWDGWFFDAQRMR